MALRPSSARYRCRVVAREGGACVPGHEGVREMLRDLYEAFAETHVELSDIGIWETDLSRSAAPVRVVMKVAPRPSRPGLA